MIFGDKTIFAIEVNVNNLFHDEYIGEGNFIVYVNNYSYGLMDEYATVYLCIVDILKIFSSELKNINLGLEKYNEKEIAMYQYIQKYGEKGFANYDEFLLQKTSHMVEWLPESAFDDGSHLIHLDNDGMVRLIGYKSCCKGERFSVDDSSVNEVIISRAKFVSITTATYKYLESLNDKKNSCFQD